MSRLALPNAFAEGLARLLAICGIKNNPVEHWLHIATSMPKHTTPTLDIEDLARPRVNPGLYGNKLSACKDRDSGSASGYDDRR